MSNAHIGFVGLSGVQSHSAGDAYPLSVSYSHNPLTGGGTAYVWNMATGQHLASFPFIRETFEDRNRLAHKCLARLARDGVDLVGVAVNPPLDNRSAHARRYLANVAELQLRRTGGFTLDSSGNAPPQYGYVVSLPGMERRLFGLVGASTVRRFIDDNPLENGQFYGGWFDNWQTYLDVSVWIAERSEAIRQAQENGQLAIYDILAGQSFSVPTPAMA